jgi:hypothetical protein
MPTSVHPFPWCWRRLLHYFLSCPLAGLRWFGYRSSDTFCGQDHSGRELRWPCGAASWS